MSSGGESFVSHAIRSCKMRNSFESSSATIHFKIIASIFNSQNFFFVKSADVLNLFLTRLYACLFPQEGSLFGAKDHYLLKCECNDFSEGTYCENCKKGYFKSNQKCVK